MIPQDVLEIAQRELNTNQFRAWELSLRYSQRDVALITRVARTTAVDRIDRAWQLLEPHGIRANAAGLPYMEDA